jgi:hypothetical protein
MSKYSKQELKQFSEQLSPYLPEAALPFCLKLLLQHHVQLTVAPPRKTKLGDYRPGLHGHPHRISVNGDLNPYSFLVTYLHEFAHLFNYQRHGLRVAAHGPEWKQAFGKLLGQALRLGAFPPELARTLGGCIGNLSASSCTDPVMYAALAKYDLATAGNVQPLSNLPVGSTFAYEGRTFRLDEPLRVNYRCTELSSGRMYRIRGVVLVEPV